MSGCIPNGVLARLTQVQSRTTVKTTRTLHLTDKHIREVLGVPDDAEVTFTVPTGVALAVTENLPITVTWTTVEETQP